MKVIWLTGGSGSGKSTVANILAERGFSVIDADGVARQILNTGTAAYDEVVSFFGEGILLPDKSIDRRGLGDIVFTDSEKLSVLNGITHKYIKKEIENALCDDKNYLIDAPLPNTYGIACDMTIAVTAPKDMRTERIMQRDKITREQAEYRIASQISDEEYCAIADAVILNSGDMKKLCRNIDRILGV